MAYAFVGAVVHVDEECFPLFGQCVGVDGESVVLRCDETFVVAILLTGWLWVRYPYLSL